MTTSDRPDTAVERECYVVSCENPADSEFYSYRTLTTYGVCEEHESEVER